MNNNNSSTTIIEYAKKSLLDELHAAAVYSRLERLFKDKQVKEKLRKMAQMEARHAEFWLSFLKKRGIDISNVKVSKLKLSLELVLYRILGIALSLKLMEAGEREATKIYALMLESNELSDEEKERLREILKDELLHEQELAEEEERFKDLVDHIRDAVLGMSDGLVEVLSVAAGLAGAYGDPLNVALGGTIVGIAGALSMGIGAFTSVRAQKQVRLGLLSRIKIAVNYVAHALYSRVVGYMSKKGFSRQTSESIAKEALRNKELLARIIAEEEYGLREEKLESPGKAGLYTGLFYIVGAIVPLIPYYMRLPILLSLPLSFSIAALMLAMMGFVIAVAAEIGIKKKALELVLAGLGSATLTFLIGKLASWLLGIEVG